MVCVYVVCGECDVCVWYVCVVSVYVCVYVVCVLYVCGVWGGEYVCVVSVYMWCVVSFVCVWYMW